MSDPRIKQTRDRLGDALIDLVREKPFDEIRVQDVLDRAGEGRSTFYAHYKDERDLVVSDCEEFLHHVAAAVPPDGRVLRVRELFAHVRENVDLLHAFERAGLLADFFALAEGIFAAATESRLPPATPHRAMKARAVGGAAVDAAQLEGHARRAGRVLPLPGLMAT